VSPEAIAYADLGLACALVVGILLAMCMGILTARLVQP
jgi:hypothetical protein